MEQTPQVPSEQSTAELPANNREHLEELFYIKAEEVRTRKGLVNTLEGVSEAVSILICEHGSINDTIHSAKNHNRGNVYLQRFYETERPDIQLILFAVPEVEDERGAKLSMYQRTPIMDNVLFEVVLPYTDQILPVKDTLLKHDDLLEIYAKDSRKASRSGYYPFAANLAPKDIPEAIARYVYLLQELVKQLLETTRLESVFREY